MRGCGDKVATVVYTFGSADAPGTVSVSMESPAASSLRQTNQSENQKRHRAGAEQGEGKKQPHKSQTGADPEKRGTPRGLRETVGGAVCCEEFKYLRGFLGKV